MFDDQVDILPLDRFFVKKLEMAEPECEEKFDVVGGFEEMFPFLLVGVGDLLEVGFGLGEEGVRLFWNGDVRRFRPPKVGEVDATGAGDIFAAAFFVRLYTTRDPWEAARFATQVSARSVTRPGLFGIPTGAEIEESMMEVL